MTCPVVNGPSIGAWDPLPRKVHLKHGAYYLVHANKWHRLGKSRDAAKTRLAELISEFNIPLVDLDFLRNLFWTAKKRAKRRGIQFEISYDDVLAMWEAGGGRCALTGIRLSEANPGHLRRRPWIPSLDRIDPSRGYTRENTRLVCFAVNVALNAWGETVFAQMAIGFLARARVNEPASATAP